MNDEELLKLSLEIASKTIGFDIKQTKKEDINQRISDIINKCLDTHDVAITGNGLDEDIVMSINQKTKELS